MGKTGTQLRFARVRLRNWKNFREIEVDLQTRVFLVGPNASGKSNFLDVFRFLRDLVLPGGGFHAAVQRRGGVSAIRSLAARRHPQVEIEVAVAPMDGGMVSLWEYRLVFGQDSQRRPVIHQERVIRDGHVLLDRPDEEDRQDRLRLTQTHLEQINMNREFRELADFFAQVRYLHLVPQLVREPDRSLGRENDPFGGDFLERLAKTPTQTRQARLRRIREALQIAVPQLVDIELWRDARGTPHLRGKYEHWRARGAWQTEEQFSDGTLRLMGLLWALMDGTGPLLLEEPELSLHPEVVRYIPQMFARLQGRKKTRRQILVSTHSPDLLRDDGIGLDEVLLLLPAKEGTLVKPASAFEEVRLLLEEGHTLADVVIPMTRPEHVEQLPLFMDR